MPFDLRTADLGALNSLTKYPSIPTFHTLDPANGGLLDTHVAFTGPVLGTEKVDGTNSRVIRVPGGDYLLGSREELLYAKGDLLGNPAQGIVAALRAFADSMPPLEDDVIRVHYLEVYGGKVTSASKQYTGSRAVGHRLFDVAVIPDYTSILALPPERISSWRENGGPAWLSEEELAKSPAEDGLTLTPRLFTVDAADLPSDLAAMRAFLGEHLPRTRSALDEGAGGAAEGIVLRTPDRAVIAKARFQDYDRTLRRRSPA
ncbi:RNA ligase family protein [Labedaea rhizosphaerae]|uniref:RNA ligase n=1 Tax=Labedaea rhizosphaerae TaxID=598644 RepID=A0A4R6RW60_LABRH|nr:RNA ligase family protein [Labedaea rhizosphaerae]TDP91183.1 RNA ligase [Labedaea rhizosphaerae]